MWRRLGFQWPRARGKGQVLKEDPNWPQFEFDILQGNKIYLFLFLSFFFTKYGSISPRKAINVSTSLYFFTETLIPTLHLRFYIHLLLWLLLFQVSLKLIFCFEICRFRLFRMPILFLVPSIFFVDALKISPLRHLLLGHHFLPYIFLLSLLIYVPPISRKLDFSLKN